MGACYSKPKALIQNQLLVPCLQVAFAMCNEITDEEEEEDDEDTYLPPHQFGAQLVDHFACTLSSKKVFLFRLFLWNTHFFLVFVVVCRSFHHASNS